MTVQINNFYRSAPRNFFIAGCVCATTAIALRVLGRSSRAAELATAGFFFTSLIIRVLTPRARGQEKRLPEKTEGAVRWVDGVLRREDGFFGASLQRRMETVHRAIEAGLEEGLTEEGRGRAHRDWLCQKLSAHDLCEIVGGGVAYSFGQTDFGGGAETERLRLLGQLARIYPEEIGLRFFGRLGRLIEYWQYAMAIGLDSDDGRCLTRVYCEWAKLHMNFWQTLCSALKELSPAERLRQIPLSSYFPDTFSRAEWVLEQVRDAEELDHELLERLQKAPALWSLPGRFDDLLPKRLRAIALVRGCYDLDRTRSGEGRALLRSYCYGGWKSAGGDASAAKAWLDECLDRLSPKEQAEVVVLLSLCPEEVLLPSFEWFARQVESVKGEKLDLEGWLLAFCKEHKIGRGLGKKQLMQYLKWASFSADPPKWLTLDHLWENLTEVFKKKEAASVLGCLLKEFDREWLFGQLPYLLTLPKKVVMKVAVSWPDSWLLVCAEPKHKLASQLLDNMGAFGLAHIYVYGKYDQKLEGILDTLRRGPKLDVPLLPHFPNVAWHGIISYLSKPKDLVHLRSTCKALRYLVGNLPEVVAVVTGSDKGGPGKTTQFLAFDSIASIYRPRLAYGLLRPHELKALGRYSEKFEVYGRVGRGEVNWMTKAQFILTDKSYEDVPLEAMVYHCSATGTIFEQLEWMLQHRVPNPWYRWEAGVELLVRHKIVTSNLARLASLLRKLWNDNSTQDMCLIDEQLEDAQERELTTLLIDENLIKQANHEQLVDLLVCSSAAENLRKRIVARLQSCAHEELCTFLRPYLDDEVNPEARAASRLAVDLLPAVYLESLVQCKGFINPEEATQE